MPNKLVGEKNEIVVNTDKYNNPSQVSANQKTMISADY